MSRCELCGEETFTEEELKELFDKMACPKCIEEYEEGSDGQQLDTIMSRRGKEWVIKHLE